MVSLVTWNVLAQSYIRSSYYPHVQLAQLDADVRLPRLVSVLNELVASNDIVFCQEFEQSMLDLWPTDLVLPSHLHFSSRATERLDGCLAASNKPLSVSRHLLNTQEHIAQIAVYPNAPRDLVVLNTHMQWSPEDASPHEGEEQALELIELARVHNVDLIVGDLNSTPAQRSFEAFRHAGWTAQPLPSTAFIDKKGWISLDHVLFAPETRWTLETSETLHQEAVIPGTFPSDHLPVRVTVSLG